MDEPDPEGVSEADTHWLRHPFGRLFDLLSAQYGWTDDQLLDLTLARLRHARDMVTARLAEERNWQIDIAEQVTRTLVAHIRSAAGDKDAGRAASRVQLFKRGASSKVARVQELAGKLGGSPGLNEIDPDLVRRAYGAR